MKTIGHRGLSGRYPENTMLSFQKAVEANCDGIELDVHLSKDGQLIVIHDETVDRTTDGTGFVRDKTLSELQGLVAGAGFGSAFGPVRIPSFEQYCTWARDLPIFTNVELKTDRYCYEDIEEKVVDMVRRFHLEDRMLFSSFNHPTVMKTRELAPEIPCGLLVGSCGMGNAGFYARKLGMQYYHPDISTLDSATVEGCKAHGIRLNVWTVDTMDDLLKVTDWQVDGIITDYADVVSSWLASRP